jgi:hypothetical protein
MNTVGKLAGGKGLKILVTLFLVTATPNLSLAQRDSSWHWHMQSDASGVKRSQHDLEMLVKEHQLWYIYGQPNAKRLDLSHASLDSADLRSLPMDFLIADSSSLVRANLSGSSLMGASMIGADLRFAHLENVVFTSANLTNANLNHANVAGSLWGGDKLRVFFSDGTQRDTVVAPASLHGANLKHTNMSRADLSGVNVSGAIFEVDSLPDIPSIASCQNLKELRYDDNPARLVELRESLARAGFRDQEREVICALRRQSAPWMETVFFDWTCEFGCNLRRPWWLIIGLWLACGALYCACTIRSRGSGVTLILPVVVTEGRPEFQGDFGPVESDEEYFRYSHGPRFGNKKVQYSQLHPSNLFLSPGAKNKHRVLPIYCRLIAWTLLFSAMSAFNIGFRDINFGRWLRSLIPFEIDLQGYGWARSVSGFQSLISVYLVALWVVSFSGTPFK